jgi:hypothetical protein
MQTNLSILASILYDFFKALAHDEYFSMYDDDDMNK